MNNRIALCGGLAVISIFALTGDVSALTKKVAPQKASLSYNDSEVRLSSFSGNRMKVGTLWNIEADCKSAQPDVRIVRQPKGGELTFEELRTKVALSSNNPRAHCNGKPVNAANVYYESRDDYTGTDRFEIEVDYKIGQVRKYTVYVNVR